MTADTDPGPLRAVNGDRGIPTDPGTVTPLEIFVARKLGLVLGGDGIEVVSGWHHGNAEVQLFRSLQEAEHDLTPALVTLRFD